MMARQGVHEILVYSLKTPDFYEALVYSLEEHDYQISWYARLIGCEH
jgi:hypothetical protein